LEFVFRIAIFGGAGVYEGKEDQPNESE